MKDSVTESTKGGDIYDKWRVKEDMRTVLEAERIKKDATRMKHVRRAAKEELAEMKAMQELAKG